MCGRPRLVGLLWLACLLAGALCLTAGGAGDQKPGQVVTLHHQQTIVTMKLTSTGELTRCDTTEVNFPDQERRALAAIRRERPVTTVTLSNMLEALLRCQRLDSVRLRRHPSGQAAPQPAPQLDTSTLLRGLVPGTKWCGPGDTADGWNDLGPNHDLDRCCRTHDLCPVKVKAYKRRYDLFNWAVYTKSHCACDQEFYRCLKSSLAREADHVGRLFFDLLQPQCVQGRSCAPHEPADACLKRLKVEGGPKVAGLRFFDQPQRYQVIPPLAADVAGDTGGGNGGGGGTVGIRAGNETEEWKSGGVGGDSENIVQIATVVSQGAPTKAPSSTGGGLSSFFSRIWNQLG